MKNGFHKTLAVAAIMTFGCRDPRAGNEEKTDRLTVDVGRLEVTFPPETPGMPMRTLQTGLTLALVARAAEPDRFFVQKQVPWIRERALPQLRQTGFDALRRFDSATADSLKAHLKKAFNDLLRQEMVDDVAVDPPRWFVE